jgi:formylmethanofuran dehydrogenase subunit B
MDDVPIPLRPAFDSPYPSDEEVLKRIEKRIRELQGFPAITINGHAH